MSTHGHRARAFATVAVLLSAASLVGGSPVAASATRPYFSQARNLWLSEAEMISSALQNVPLVDAVHELQLGRSIRGADTTGYAAAITTIEEFERIPITSETEAQMTAAHRDVAALNAFFAVTPREVAVLDRDFPAGTSYDAARRAFDREPMGVGEGVTVSALKAVVAELQRASITQPTRSILYTSAIADARSLERATPADVATSERTLTNPYGQDVYYLNVFFRTDRLHVSTAPL